MDRATLKDYYIAKGYSTREIAEVLGCSMHKVNYWLKKYHLPKRSISEAQYIKHNKLGDPFTIKANLTAYEERLFGLGIGIYWGEGNKRNKTAVRVGNTDPSLIAAFVNFLVIICGVKKTKIRYGLQLFSDVSEQDALNFWQNRLKITRNQIMPTVNRIKSGKIGTYKFKNQYGVMTVYVFNRKLRDWLVEQLYVPR